MDRFSRIALSFLVFTGLLHSQTRESLEQRIKELEMRVSVLEAKIGRSMQPQAAAPAPSVPRPTELAASRFSGGVTASAAQSAYPVSVRLVDKSLNERGPGEDTDQLGISFEFENTGSEHLTSFEGDIELRSATGELLYLFPFDIAKYLTVGTTTRWYASIPFSAVNPSHRTLHTAALHEIRPVLRLRQVMYYDTRVERFN